MAESDRTGEDFYCFFTIDGSTTTEIVFDDDDGDADGRISATQTQDWLEMHQLTVADVLAEVRCFENMPDRVRDIEVSYGAHLHLPGDGTPVQGQYLEPWERGYCIERPYLAECKQFNGTIEHVVNKDRIESHFTVTSEPGGYVWCRFTLFDEEGVQLGAAPAHEGRSPLAYTLTHPFLPPGTYRVQTSCHDDARVEDPLELNETLALNAAEPARPQPPVFGS
ncbi:hypothetical protein ONR57_12825 [Hoyosella sp. YIM 151337]|uniref:hypothetical protein n=1 Tax=Hoyosella sp. YIM 151337 TaxID=2992742 RepID=UPI00223572AF|nr:hypothetical protein [Hoyosella sp. YIM 151337]MCW4354185.1 hypothetical protein [Hoyosella sp. YIM 151337]